MSKFLLKEFINQIINETPIEDYTKIGDFSKRHSFHSSVDRKLIDSPGGEIKIRRIWQNTPITFNLVFINDPRVKNIQEIGAVDESYVRNTMKITEDELKIDQSACTIIFTNNSGDERAMSSGFILAHRFGHALAATDRGGFNSRDPAVAKAWDEYRKRLTTIFKEILEYVYDVDTSSFNNKDFMQALPNQTILKLAAQQIGTMKSARDSNLRNWYEFAYELFAQYLLYGKIKLNPLPNNLIVKLKPFGRKQYSTANKHSQEMYNRHDLEYYSTELETMLDYVIESVKGKIFVM